MSSLLNRAVRHRSATTNAFITSRIWCSGIVTEKVPTVKHDRAAQCFTVNLNTAGNEDNAILRYSLTGNGEIHLLSTNVPESFRGKGIAAYLAKAALDFVVKENLKARVSCWYISKYVEENPAHGYKDHIVE